MVRFNYKFNKRTNLRINYRGRTSQPSMTQLQPVADISDPLNTTMGNPDLKPTYTNNLFIRFQKFVPEKQTALMVMANLNYVINDIVNKSVYVGNTGKKMTTYDNVNGNYNGNIRVLFNTPLKNRKFSINSMTMASYANSNGFINDEKNTNKNLVLMERAGIDFRSDYLDLGLNGNIRPERIQLRCGRNDNDLSPTRFQSGKRYQLVHQLRLFGWFQAKRSAMERRRLQVIPERETGYTPF